MCNNPTKTYKYIHELINKYMNVPNFEDTFINDNITFYYPKATLNASQSDINFTKCVTIQWRKVWPELRKKQERILANGPELAEELASKLPSNILVRLVDTATLPIIEQISIMYKTDYFVGIHGAGLVLSIFAPKNVIIHELLNRNNMNGLMLMASTSGHIRYSDVIRSVRENDGGFEKIFFNKIQFSEKVIYHMKENNLI